MYRLGEWQAENDGWGGRPVCGFLTRAHWKPVAVPMALKPNTAERFAASTEDVVILVLGGTRLKVAVTLLLALSVT